MLDRVVRYIATGALRYARDGLLVLVLVAIAIALVLVISRS